MFVSHFTMTIPNSTKPCLIIPCKHHTHTLGGFIVLVGEIKCHCRQWLLSWHLLLLIILHYVSPFSSTMTAAWLRICRMQYHRQAAIWDLMNRDCCAVFDDVAFISSILASKSHLSGGAGMIALFWFLHQNSFHDTERRWQTQSVWCVLHKVNKLGFFPQLTSIMKNNEAALFLLLVYLS